MEVLPSGNVLSDQQIERNFVKALRQYCGYATLTNVALNDEIHSDIGSKVDIENINDFDITLSELAVIRPLFDLYVELENATNLESSRGQGLDVYGRGTGEVQADIREMEANFHKLCFVEAPFTV